MHSGNGEEDTTPEPAGPPPAAPDNEEHGRRPTPVRVVMEGDSEDAGVPEDKPRRLFSDPEGGTDWVVWVSGRSGSGILPLRPIPLMELTFAAVADPGAPLKRATCQGSELDRLSDGELIRLLRTGNPYRSPSEEGEPRGGRGKKGRGRHRPRG